MRILVLYAEDYPWDIRVEKISQGLAASGHEVTLMVRNLERRPRTETVDGLRCLRVTSPRLPAPVNAVCSLPAFFNPVWKLGVRRALAQEASDLLIVRDLPLAPLAISEGKRRGIPVLVDMAENHPAMWRDIAADAPIPLLSLILKCPYLATRMERWVVQRADAIFVVVEEMRDHLLSLGCPHERISVVSNTPDLGRFDRVDEDLAFDWLPPADTLDIVYVGFISAFRGLQHVIRALALLDDMAPRPRLIVAGDGDNIPELRALAAELGVADRVVFSGWLSHELVPSLIQQADIGVIPHRKTGHTDSTVPNKIFDYMACRKPVLVTAARPLERLVTAHDCGATFRSEDPADLAAKLRTLADPARRARMGTNGRAAVEKRYHWQHDLDEIRRVVGNLGCAH